MIQYNGRLLYHSDAARERPSVGRVGLAAFEHLCLHGAFKAIHMGLHPGTQCGKIKSVGFRDRSGTYKLVKVAHKSLKVCFHNTQQRIAVTYHQTTRFDPDGPLALHALELLVHALA